MSNPITFRELKEILSVIAPTFNITSISCNDYNSNVTWAGGLTSATYTIGSYLPTVGQITTHAYGGGYGGSVVNTTPVIQYTIQGNFVIPLDKLLDKEITPQMSCLYEQFDEKLKKFVSFAQGSFQIEEGNLKTNGCLSFQQSDVEEIRKVVYDLTFNKDLESHLTKVE